MNEGVKILLERMKTNPDEFLDRGKWKSLIEGYASYLNPDDYKLIREELNKLHQQRFTEQVMKELLAPEEDDSLGKPWYTNRGNATVSAGVTPVIPSITLETSEHLRAHLDALKREVEVRKKPVLKKQHKTLFGKLFNYS
jgi:hypothetical protein